MTKELNPDIGAALSKLQPEEVQRVYLVACGGSLSIMHAGKYFLDRNSKTLVSEIYNSEEFVYRNPAALGPGSLVILCSQTGTTKETVRAVLHAKTRGAATIAMTLDPNSPLGLSADSAVRYQASYTTGVPIDAADSNYAVLYMLLAGLIERAGGADLVPELLTSLENLQPAIDRAHQRFASRFDDFAPRFKDASCIYTLASGPNLGAAYSFSICVLMEMQRYDSQAIHANEFFHGPFEVVDETTNFIVLIGADDTRPLAERAQRFLHRFGSKDRVLELDAQELDLSGLGETWRGYLVPLIFFDTLWKFAYRLANLRNRPMMTARRYMKKLSDY